MVKTARPGRAHGRYPGILEPGALPRARFDDDFARGTARTLAPSAVQAVEKDRVVRISPRLHRAPDDAAEPLYIEDAEATPNSTEALDEYGNAIKQLAAANIFPGDMLLKNFGITRHGRVVFYDYDEICYLSEVNFRQIPEPRTPEEEMSDEIWYPVGKNDVFPEEFRRFLFGRREIKNRFHPDAW